MRISDWSSDVCSSDLYQMTPNPMIMASAIIQRTSKVRVALLGPLVPLNNPVRLAEEVAMLDALSGGRMEVLFLRGTPNEHKTRSEARRVGKEDVSTCISWRTH